MIRRRILPGLLLSVLVASPTLARADRRDLYTLVEFPLGIASFYDPPTTNAQASAPTYGAGLLAFYGITNQLHVGGVLRYVGSTDVGFKDVTTTAGTGDLYANHRALAVGALAVYRIDTGRILAPLAQLELGFARHTYRDVALSPTGSGYYLPADDATETLPYARAGAGVEVRLWSNLYGSAVVSAEFSPSALRRWSLIVPLAVGWIW
jgi:hypothetical protein